MDYRFVSLLLLLSLFPFRIGRGPNVSLLVVGTGEETWTINSLAFHWRELSASSIDCSFVYCDTVLAGECV